MSERIRLGMLTPSSNTVLEPVTTAMAADLPGLTVHFARFRVVEIALGAAARGQFENRPMLDAAALLVDAKVHAICWNGTSAGWLGLEADRRLCTAITGRTGVPATSSVLSLAEMFRRAGVTRYGLVSPYTEVVQQKIVANFESEGFICTGERHSGEHRNWHFAAVSADAITAMVRAVAASRPQAIVILCTNMNGVALTPALEAETGIPIYDSIATAMWGSLRAVGVEPARLGRWGRVFREVA